MDGSLSTISRSLLHTIPIRPSFSRERGGSPGLCTAAWTAGRRGVPPGVTLFYNGTGGRCITFPWHRRTQRRLGCSRVAPAVSRSYLQGTTRLTIRQLAPASCSFSSWFSVWYFSGNDKQEKDQDNHHQACCLERTDHFKDFIKGTMRRLRSCAHGSLCVLLFISTPVIHRRCILYKIASNGRNHADCSEPAGLRQRRRAPGD